jgi:serine phosphatase RsbU (regulator of sigma subunit)
MRPSTRYHPSREYRTEPSEDSDIIVALFRSAVIIAFVVRIVPDSAYQLRPGTWAMVVAAALYTLALMLGYLVSRRWLTRRRREGLSAHPLGAFVIQRRVGFQRALALLVDLFMVSVIIRDVNKPEWLDIYYIIVAVGAVWFYREGGVLTALAATACVLGVMTTLYPGTRLVNVWADPYLRSQLTSRAVMLVLVGIVTGWLARARDAERRDRERMDWELQMARRVQQDLLPERLPEVPGYELGLRFSPAHVVGGDYYDALLAPDGRLVVLLADVAGKSIAAVLHLSLLRSHLHQAVADGLAPGEIGTRLNAALAEALPPGSFVALFCAAIDLPSGRTSWVNCGHTPPVVVRVAPESKPEILYTGNIVLGVTHGPHYDERETTLERGDLLVCCTDGIAEIMDEDWRAFDTEGIARAASAARARTADEVAEYVLQAAREHAVGRPADDATLLVVRRLPGPPA